MVTMTEPTETPDFTKPREPHRFRLGGKDYAAPAIISAITLRKAGALAASFTSIDQSNPQAVIGAIGEAFTILVPGPQGQEIAARITTDEEDPIDVIGEALPCMMWLMGSYGLRPTQPSSDSSNGSDTPTGDASSTDGVSPTESASQN
jgi:hypothetical protein